MSATTERPTDLKADLEFHVGSDVGGTFTDLWVVAKDGRSVIVKTPTTTDVISGVLDGLRLAAESLGIEFKELCSHIMRFGHGTTVGLNALLTGRYPRTAVVTNEGFADTLEIGRLRRQYTGLSESEISDFYVRGKWPPLVSREYVREVQGRIDSAGEEIQALDEDVARAVIRGLRAEEIEAVAICTLWSTANPAHEDRLRELFIEEFPESSVALSHEVSPSVGEYARMSTTAANAALKPVAGHYVKRLAGMLAEHGVAAQALMMTSAGGVVPGSYLTERPVMALFSGPSAGVIAAQQIGAQIDRENLLTVDLGGTSFDVGLIVNGRPLMTSDVSLAGADIRVPSIDVRSIGAGGGSIARVEMGELFVGPDSAGADPGPACYGRGGTQPTATDADLVLGILDPDNFVGGRLSLDLDAARAAIASHVADPLGISIEQAAWGIREVLDSRMGDLLRQVTIARGHDPRDFSLVAGGGGGSSHAYALAEALNMSEIIVPAVATAQSAWGTGTCDIVMSVERTIGTRLSADASPSAGQVAAVEQAVLDAASSARQAINQNVGGVDAQLRRTFAMSYWGQVHTLDVDYEGDEIDADGIRGCIERFEAEHTRLFGEGATFSEAGYVIVSVRATATAVLAAPSEQTAGQSLEIRAKRPVIFGDPFRPIMTDVYTVERPGPGQELTGPLLVEYPGHTVVVPPGVSAATDTHGNLLIRVEANA